MVQVVSVQDMLAGREHGPTRSTGKQEQPLIQRLAGQFRRTPAQTQAAGERLMPVEDRTPPAVASPVPAPAAMGPSEVKARPVQHRSEVPAAAVNRRLEGW